MSEKETSGTDSTGERMNVDPRLSKKDQDENPEIKISRVDAIFGKFLGVFACVGFATLSLPFVGLSAMGFDAGFSWGAAIIFGLFCMIPVSLIGLAIYILFK